MNETPTEHPADIIAQCPDPCDNRGFTRMYDFASTTMYANEKVRAKGQGYGHSKTSQAEADQMAMDRAMESASKLLRLKVKALGWLASLMGLKIKAKDRQQPIFPELEPLSPMIAPKLSPFHGTIQKKPWDHKVTAIIPHLDTIEPLLMCIEILRAQTEKPYILVIDTGSPRECCEMLEKIRAEDLEIHYIRAHAYQHSSEPVTVALDLAHALCHTEFIYHTHADCFLRRFDFIESLVSLCSEKNPIVGYRMSPRDWLTDEWKWMIGHTNTIMHMPTIHKSGAMWSMDRMHREYGYAYTGGGWPDTETGFNHLIRDAGIKPIFIGEDQNHRREIDSNRDHIRSYPGSSIVGGDYHKVTAGWMAEGLKDARKMMDAHYLVNEKSGG